MKITVVIISLLSACLLIIILPDVRHFDMILFWKFSNHVDTKSIELLLFNHSVEVNIHLDVNELKKIIFSKKSPHHSFFIKSNTKSDSKPLLSA